MNVSAGEWYSLDLYVRFAESQEIDTLDPAWLSKLLSGPLAPGRALWMEVADLRPVEMEG